MFLGGATDGQKESIKKYTLPWNKSVPLVMRFLPLATDYPNVHAHVG